MPRINKVLLSCVLFCLSLPVFAIPFQNGDFSSATDWVDFSATGSTQIVGGEAVLETGDSTDPYSAVLLQGDDGLFNFFDPISLDAGFNTLSFDVRFESLGADTTETGASIFSDYLVVALYDADDFSGLSDIVLDPGINSSVSVMTTFILDISSAAGRDVALSFELSDENDGLNSRVFLDNVNFYSAVTSVPEPITVALFGLGLLSLVFTRSNSRRRIF